MNKLNELRLELALREKNEEEAMWLATTPTSITLQHYTDCIIAVDECKRRLNDYMNSFISLA